jgi:acyl carrier protein
VDDDSLTGDDSEARVVLLVAAALERRPDEIDPALPLHELGAESLDFLDIAFRLEREFRVRMPRLNLLQRAEQHFGPDALVQDGALTSFGLEVLRQTMPEVDPARLRPGLRASELGGLISARTFARVVRRMLAAKREALRACAACGADALRESQVTPEATCGACGQVQVFPAGDEVLLQDLLALPR